MSAIEYLQQIINIKDAAFPDIWFGSRTHGKPFDKSFDCGATAIRLRLEMEDYFHLASLRVSVRRQGGDEFLLPPPENLQSSSRYLSFQESAAALFDFANEKIAFHTDRGASYISFPFPEKLTVRRIEINNRGWEHEDRAWSLAIDARDDEGLWHNIYSHSKRVDCFLAVIQELGLHYGLDYKIQDSIQKLAIHAFRGDGALYPELSNFKQHVGVEPELAAAIKSQLNQVVARWQLEITTHGLYRSFRFWSTAEITRYLNLASQMVGALRDAGIEAFLFFGTLLGICREGRLISHDDDIDIFAILPAATFASNEQCLHHVSEILIAGGFEVSTIFFNHLHARKQGGRIVDVFVGLQRGNTVEVNPSKSKQIRYDQLYPTFQYAYCGVDCFFPRNPLHCLDAVYGESWRITNTDFVH